MGDAVKKLKRTLLVIFILLAAFAVYVEAANRHSKNMTYRQKVLKAVYPAFMWWTRQRGKNTLELTRHRVTAPVSFYSLGAVLNNGDTLSFAGFKGKKILLVNTASDCGYTAQYGALQQLAEQYQDRLVVLGFPANDFKEQEKGSDAEIESFCRLNYGVTFPLVKKSIVVKKEGQHPVYRWLTDSTQNGWNSKAPSWNFAKYLVNEEGMLTHYFGSSVSPLGEDIRKALQ